MAKPRCAIKSIVSAEKNLAPLCRLVHLVCTASVFAVTCTIAPAEAAPPAAPAAASPLVLSVGLDQQNDLEAAERMIADRRWSLALPLLQAILNSPGEPVLQIAGSYLPARTLVNRRIASLPREAIAAYRLLYDPPARRAYEAGLAAHSLADLRTVAERHIHTNYGAKAAVAAAGMMMDAGEFEAALLMLERTDVLSLSVDTARAVAARKLLCLARLGRREKPAALLARLAETGVTRVKAGDRVWDAEAFLDASLSNTGAAHDEPIATPPEIAGLSPQVLSLPWLSPAYPMLPTAPSTRAVADDERLYVKRDGTVFAIRRDTGEMAWVAGRTGLWLEMGLAVSGAGTYGGEALPPFIPIVGLNQWRTYDNHGLASLTVAEGRVYSIAMNAWEQRFGEPLWEAQPEDVALTNRLRCHDAQTGAVLWQAGGPDSPIPAWSDCWFFTAPAVAGGRAHVLVARRGVLYAACLDATTGERLWEQRIGALESRQQVQRMVMEFFLADTAPPGVADGLAFYPTGHGVVCAVEAQSGRLVWIAEYPRAAQWINRLGQRLNVPAGPWAPTAPVIAQGVCLLAPTDTDSVLALSVETGQIVWQSPFPRGVAVLGVAEGCVYVQERGVTCLEVRTGEERWHWSPPSPWSAGIGAVHGGRVYVPQQNGVLVLDAELGTKQALLASPGLHALSGNVLPLHDAVALTGPEQIMVWGPPERTWGQAGGSTPDVAADWATLSEALRRSDAGEAMRRYFHLCAGSGMEQVSAPYGKCSLWTVVAQEVRQQCAKRPALAAAWSEHVGSWVEEAGEDTLLDIARYSPFGADHRTALQRLARLWQDAGRAPEARRASIASTLKTNASPRSPSTPLPPSATAASAWSMPGTLVMPVQQHQPEGDAWVLIVGNGQLQRVRVSDGQVEWTVPLPTPPRPAGLPPGARSPVANVTGPGYPSYGIYGRTLMVATPSIVMGLDSDTGQVIWQRTFVTRTARMPVRTQVPRMETIQRARRGLPLHGGWPASRLVPIDGFRAGPMAACRVAARNDVTVLDPYDGTVLLEMDRRLSRERRGPIALASGDRFCVLSPDDSGDMLRIHDAVDGKTLAEWCFRPGLVVESMTADGAGGLLLAHADGVFSVDSQRLDLVAEWPVDRGVDAVLFADGEVTIVRTFDDATVDARNGRLIYSDESPTRVVPLWCRRRDETLFLLTARQSADLRPRGVQGGFRGTDFVLSALGLPSGRPGSDEQVVSAPVLAGDVWLVARATDGAFHVMGIGAATGEAAFTLEIPADDRPRAAQLMVREGRLIVSAGGHVTALRPTGPKNSR